MHIPSRFELSDQRQCEKIIRDYGFGALVLADEQGLDVHHLPVYVLPAKTDTRTILQCHVARANRVWQRIGGGLEVMAVFQGPHTYISPSWYPTKQETGRAVPTWNYLAVHARGQARIVEDRQWLLTHLRNLSDQHEAGFAEPWRLDDAPQDYIEAMLRALVGIEIRVDSLVGQCKASQNQPLQNRSAVKAHLARSEHSYARAMALLITDD